MFQIEQAITDWRKKMSTGLRDGDALDELENHLREENARQTKAGVEAQKAFKTAVARMGNITQLKSEFENVRAPKRWWQAELYGSSELERKMVEWLMLGSGLFIGGGMSYNILFKRGSCAEMTASQQAWSLAAALLIGFLVAFGKYLHPLLPVLAGTRKRNMAIFGGSLFMVVEFSVLFWVFLPQTTLTLGQLLVTLLWAMVPWGASIGVAMGLHEASRRATRQISPS
jgi:hypothetical protein